MTGRINPFAGALGSRRAQILLILLHKEKLNLLAWPLVEEDMSFVDQIKYMLAAGWLLANGLVRETTEPMDKEGIWLQITGEGIAALREFGPPGDEGREGS